MLEVGGVHRAGRPENDRRLPVGAGRDGPQGLEQKLRIVLNRPDPVALEELGHEPRHGQTVLEHVGDARRSAHVVLEHAPAPRAVADEIASGDVAVHPAGRSHAVHGPGKGGTADHERPGNDSGSDDLMCVVDVVDERVQRPNPLRQAPFDVRPLRSREHARHEVHRPGPVAMPAVRAGDLEGDALLHEDRVATQPDLLEARRSQSFQRGQKARGMRERAPVTIEELVAAPVGRGVVGDRRCPGIHAHGPRLARRHQRGPPPRGQSHPSGGWPHGEPVTLGRPCDFS